MRLPLSTGRINQVLINTLEAHVFSATPCIILLDWFSRHIWFISISGKYLYQNPFAVFWNLLFFWVWLNTACGFLHVIPSIIRIYFFRDVGRSCSQLWPPFTILWTPFTILQKLWTAPPEFSEKIESLNFKEVGLHFILSLVYRIN